MGYFQDFIGVDFWTALFTLINTLAIFYVAKKYLFVPVHNMITERQKEIDDMYADAGKAKNEAQQMRKEYQIKLSDAQATGERLVTEAVSRAQQRQEEILRRARAEANNIMEKAAADAAQEKRKAINEAKNEISDIAVAIAEKVVGREIDQKDHSALVDQFIDELGDNA